MEYVATFERQDFCEVRAERANRDNELKTRTYKCVPYGQNQFLFAGNLLGLSYWQIMASPYRHNAEPEVEVYVDVQNQGAWPSGKRAKFSHGPTIGMPSSTSTLRLSR